MTAFVQNFTGDDVKDKDRESYFMKLKLSLLMHNDRIFVLYTSKINILHYFSKALNLSHKKPFSFLL